MALSKTLVSLQGSFGASCKRSSAGGMSRIFQKGICSLCVLLMVVSFQRDSPSFHNHLNHSAALFGGICMLSPCVRAELILITFTTEQDLWKRSDYVLLSKLTSAHASSALYLSKHLTCSYLHPFKRTVKKPGYTCCSLTVRRS